MELKAWDVDKYLGRRDWPHRIFVIFGPDTGLVRERAELIARRLLGENPDPFQIVRLTADALAEDPSRLADEANQIGMFGGERVIRVSDAGQAAAGAAAANLFEAGETSAAVIFEAGDIKPSSRLRKLAKDAENAVALPCYPDGAQDLERLISDALGSLRVDPAARAMIAQRLGPDRQANRGMLETLVTYKLGDDSPVSEPDVAAVLGDQSAVGFDAIAFAAFEGRTADALSLLDKSLAEKTPAMLVTLSLARHIERFDEADAQLEQGKSTDQAVAAQRLGPKTRQAAFRRQLGLWPPIKRAMARKLCVEADIDMRGGDVDDRLICRNLVLRIGAAAQRRPAAR